jgi:hypothetical protein
VPELDKGLIFLRERELLVTGNYWNLVINLDVQWCHNTVRQIQQVFTHLEWSRRHREPPDRVVNWEEVEQARTAVDQVEQELSTLTRLLPVSEKGELGVRRKRGLFNVGGEALKFLFGVATTQQLQELHHTVEGIKTREGDVIHAVQTQLTYLKSVDEAATRNAMGLAGVARILKNVILSAWNHQREWNETMEHFEYIVEHQLNMSRLMRKLEFTVLQLQQAVLRLKEGLEVSAMGRLSSVSIPPHNLSSILQGIILKLPQDISLIAGNTIENMYLFYDVARVQAYATGTSIRLVVRIPLRGADRVMVLFRSVSLPMYLEGLDRYVQIEPETSHLAVTENGQYYSLLTETDLQRCQLGLFAFCEAAFSFIHKSRVSCSSALYCGQAKSAHEICQKVILKENFSPVWLQVKGGHPFWVYSLSSSMMVTKKCMRNGTTVSSTLTLARTGILMEDTHCQFYSEAFILLPVSDGYTNVTLIDTTVRLPHLPELLAPSEHHLISANEERTQQTLAALETIARRSTPTQQRSYVELRELLATISRGDDSMNQPTWMYVIISLSLILSLAAFIPQYWSSLVRMFTQRITPLPIEPQIAAALEMPSKPGSHTAAMDPRTPTCRCGTSNPHTEMEVMSLQTAVSVQEAGTETGPDGPPRPTERVCFAAPGRFQLQGE